MNNTENMYKTFQYLGKFNDNLWCENVQYILDSMNTFIEFPTLYSVWEDIEDRLQLNLYPGSIRFDRVLLTEIVKRKMVALDVYEVNNASKIVNILEEYHNRIMLGEDYFEDTVKCVDILVKPVYVNNLSIVKEAIQSAFHVGHPDYTLSVWDTLYTRFNFLKSKVEG